MLTKRLYDFYWITILHKIRISTERAQISKHVLSLLTTHVIPRSFDTLRLVSG